MTLPPLASNFVQLIKFSSLGAVISVNEITRRGMELSASTFRPLEIFTFIAVVYFFICWPLAMAIRYLGAPPCQPDRADPSVARASARRWPTRPSDSLPRLDRDDAGARQGCLAQSAGDTSAVADVAEAPAGRDPRRRDQPRRAGARHRQPGRPRARQEPGPPPHLQRSPRYVPDRRRRRLDRAAAQRGAARRPALRPRRLRHEGRRRLLDPGRGAARRAAPRPGAARSS